MFSPFTLKRCFVGRGGEGRSALLLDALGVENNMVAWVVALVVWQIVQRHELGLGNVAEQDKLPLERPNCLSY